MMTLVCDTETDGLLDQLTKVHSLLIKNLETGEKYSLSHHPEYVSPDPEMITDLSIEDGLRMIMQADLTIWHNGIGFDLLAISKVYPWFTLDPSKVFDTMVMSMLIWTNLLDLDEAAVKRGKKLTPKYKGRHSLAAWGQRLGYHKIEFDGGDWLTWTPEMQIYGEGDIPVTEKLYRHILTKQTDPRAIELEHAAKFVCVRQEGYGFAFDGVKAAALAKTLMSRRATLEQQLKDTFGSWKTRDEDFIPKRDNKTLGYKAGVPVERWTTHVFNPGSRQHIENRLKALFGWKPKEYTDNGQAKIDETVLASLPYPEAKLLAEFLMVQMRLGQLAEGKKGWMKVVTNKGRIHGRINPGGAVTGRATHMEPNMSAIPKVGAPYGLECRELFKASKGRVQVGCDVSGLELRMLGHFMSKFDNGAYAKIVIEGDVHWANVQALGLVPDGTKRDEKTLVIHKLFREGTKTFIYAFLYGAGGEKIGSIILDIATIEVRDGLGHTVADRYFNGKKPNPTTLARVGNMLKKTFLQKTPALKKLIDAVKDEANRRGFLIGLDGRLLHIRSPHAALNTLLQSAGALVCKRWMVEVDREIVRRGWRDLCQQVAWSHDELQFDCDPSISEELEVMLVECIVKAGAYFNISLPLTGEAKTGLNWAECH